MKNAIETLFGAICFLVAVASAGGGWIIMGMSLTGCSPEKTKPDTGYAHEVAAPSPADVKAAIENHYNLVSMRSGFIVRIEFDEHDFPVVMQRGLTYMKGAGERFLWDADGRCYRRFDTLNSIKYRYVEGKPVLIPNPPPPFPGENIKMLPLSELVAEFKKGKQHTNDGTP